MTDNDQAAVEALINVIWDGSDCRRPGWEPLARDILAAIRAGKVTVPEDAPRIAGLRAEVDLYKNGATCRAEERDSARAERDNFKRRLIEAEDGRARMHAERDAEKARADEAEAANKLLRSELIPVGWDVLEQSGCPRCGDDVVAEPAMDGDGFLDGNPARCQSCGLPGQVTVDDEGASFSADDRQWEIDAEAKRADKMKADGERAVLEERERTAKATAERDRLAGLLREVLLIIRPGATAHGYWHNEAGCAFRGVLPRIDAALAEIGGGK